MATSKEPSVSNSNGHSSLKRKRPPSIEIPSVLREIRNDKVQNFTPRNDGVSYSGVGVGVASFKGRKKFMEDTHKIASCSQGKSVKRFFGVFDGHGGKKAAEFAAENLHTNIVEMMKNCTEKEAAVREGYLKTDQEFLKQFSAVREGYLKTDQEFLKQGLSSGACCVTALIEDQEIVVSNLGDCRAVLSRGGVAEALTKDHRAALEDERKRIENKGGYVEICRGAWRVHGLLAVSRSIGDAHLKNWVLAEPETKILQLTSDMEFLVLASDGLWEEVGNQEAIDTVKRLCSVGQKLASSGDCLKDTEDRYGYVNVSPSSKLKRISLVKQPKGLSQSPSNKKTETLKGSKENGNDFAIENGSPPSKLRRISLVKRVNMKIESPTKENNGYEKRPDCGLLAACKELVNLAVSRGSLDDITVMIIDLNHFRCKS